VEEFSSLGRSNLYERVRNVLWNLGSKVLLREKDMDSVITCTEWVIFSI
jgi:hypothetical protein